MRQIVCSVILAVILLLSLVTNWYVALSFMLIGVLLWMILYKIGNGIVLLEATALLYSITCVLVPLAGYEYYSSSNSLSKLWVRYMTISEDVYYSYALPAVACFCLAITLPSFKKQLPDEGVKLKNTIVKIKQQLNKQKNAGSQIMIVGVLTSLVAKFMPVSVNFFATLFFFGSFAGLLYVYYSQDYKYKKIIMISFVLFILWNALQTGMFTLVAYMGITIFSFFQVGKKSSMLKKIAFLVAALAFFVVLQNVKKTYRVNTWTKSFEGNRAELFSNLFVDNLQKGQALLNQNALFPLYTRTNQGYNVALVMKRIPAVVPFDDGKRLLTVFASAFVPRFLWSDKPEAGGQFNMYYYAGIRIVGWSTNVGPLGEAYGSFGITGGIVYMFFLGLFIRWVYMYIFKISNKTPLIICWLTVLFFQVTSSAETDSLNIINSLIKSAFFLWLLYKFLPHWFGIISPSRIRNAKRLSVSQSS